MYAQGIDTTASSVTFSIRNMHIRTVTGTFRGLKGSVRFSPDHLAGSAFDLCIDARTVNTDNNTRDEHLREKDFFDVSTYPTICFKSTGFKKSSTGYVVNGMLNMHGVSREVSIPFTYSDNILAGVFTLNRLDYKVGESTGTFMVGNEVEVSIKCKVYPTH
jgi:polyisoprenoid-binding protein YceI